MKSKTIKFKVVYKRRNKAAISTVALLALSSYGIFFSERDFSQAVGTISAIFGIFQLLVWSATESLIKELEEKENKE